VAPHLEVEQDHQVLHPFLGEDHQIQDGRQSRGAVQNLDEHQLLEGRRVGCGSDAWDGVHRGIVPEVHLEAVGLEVRHHCLGDDRKLDVRAAIHPAADLLEQLAAGLELAAERYRPDADPSAA